MAGTRKGFTLIELLIVVVILAAIAAIVLPQFSNASAATRASMLCDDLRVTRIQISVYKHQHKGVAPGYPDGDIESEPTEPAFVAQMTLLSDADGETAPIGTEGYDFGPYLREVPVNPVNGKKTIQIIGDEEQLPTEGDDSHGWIYQPATLTIKPDASGQNESGTKYIDY